MDLNPRGRRDLVTGSPRGTGTAIALSLADFQVAVAIAIAIAIDGYLGLTFR